MSTIDEAQNFIVDNVDKGDIQDLRGDKGWGALKRTVESSLLKWTSNLLVGEEKHKGARAEQLDRLSGFYYYWEKITRLVEYKETEPNNEDN